MLRPEELELIICGTQLLDFHELEKSSRYDDGYTKDSDTIKHLWEVIHSLPLEDQKKFLFFLTGCDRAPINGLGKYLYNTKAHLSLQFLDLDQIQINYHAPIPASTIFSFLTTRISTNLRTDS
jgi:hypothetical protein